MLFVTRLLFLQWVWSSNQQCAQANQSCLHSWSKHGGHVCKDLTVACLYNLCYGFRIISAKILEKLTNLICFKENQGYFARICLMALLLLVLFIKYYIKYRIGEQQVQCLKCLQSKQPSFRLTHTFWGGLCACTGGNLCNN